MSVYLVDIRMMLIIMQALTFTIEEFIVSLAEKVVFIDYYEKYNCGANLLTQEDYDGLLELRASFELINSIPPELLEKLGKNVDPEMLKELPMFKDAEGLELLNRDTEDVLNIEFNTHNGIKVEKIEKKDDNS